MADLIASARNMTVVAEGQYNTVGMPKGSLTPATITAMVGFSRGEGLSQAPSVTSAITKLQNVHITNPGLGASANAAAANLTSMSSNLLNGGPTGFMQKMNGARAHINDSIELRKVTDFTANASYPQFGSGITDINSLATQGLDNAIGPDFTAVGQCLADAGPLYDTSDMASFGKPEGLVKKLNQTKLGNATGVNQALIQQGVDLNNISDPAYAGTVSKVMANIKDPAVINTVADQYGVPGTTGTAFGSGSAPSVPVGGGGIASLGDFTDITKLSSPINTAGLQTDLAGMGSKFNDLGAKFENSQNMKDLMDSVEKPGATNFTGAYSSLGGLMGEFQGDFNGLTGAGTGPRGLPNITDFTEAASGGPTIDAFNSGAVDASSIASIQSMVSSSQSLFTTAGIDYTAAPSSTNLGAHMQAATSLHQIGAEANGSGAGDVLKNMCDNSVFGDSVKVALAEGNNNKVMEQYGIKPPQFNPFDGLPAGGDANIASANASKLLGGS